MTERQEGKKERKGKEGERKGGEKEEEGKEGGRKKERKGRRKEGRKDGREEGGGREGRDTLNSMFGIVYHMFSYVVFFLRPTHSPTNVTPGLQWYTSSLPETCLHTLNNM